MKKLWKQYYCAPCQNRLSRPVNHQVILLCKRCKEPMPEVSLRAITKYPGITARVNGKFRRQNIDFDYLDKLNHNQKEWLSNFMEEYQSGNFKHKGKRLFKGKKRALECYGRNNSRNRDIFNHLKAQFKLLRAEEYKSSVERPPDLAPEAHENIIISLIDYYDWGLARTKLTELE